MTLQFIGGTAVIQTDWFLAGLAFVFDTNILVWPLWLTVLFLVSYGLFVWYVILLFAGDDEPIHPKN